MNAEFALALPEHLASDASVKQLLKWRLGLVITFDRSAAHADAEVRGQLPVTPQRRHSATLSFSPCKDRCPLSDALFLRLRH